jgi:aerobic-type carbon monoxide dehydrogenase small subunit (CoxS/CutS family)
MAPPRSVASALPEPPGARRDGAAKRDPRPAAPARVPTPVAFTVNGRRVRVRVPAMKRLLDVLREDLELPGSKEGCGEGECGACTVLLDGEPVNSCLVAAGQCEGARILTVEGLAGAKKLSALQQAFVEMGGAQCGICTPGMLVSSYALLRAARGRVPGEEEVREALAGNLCRCTGYQKIVDAVRAAAGGARRGAKRG